ncbi:aminotransferase class V-fold PLP-dependent enzyme [Paenibacillus crassostreae]|uniref:cysteine desulfurase n=1 Tax=Paenibacillus crassostreae TaxID=1763538 RepID=A0A167BGE7_9BACL|nr:aminotransferase class V-fold PLP-dependent enzyme [Paenibacillus crassostreae]AOZ92864.1 cysteine desulfurase [Paenibacillus crassostreae]OAB72046.1 cysteine desulfurase [Paenibacillus crassostreae]
MSFYISGGILIIYLDHAATSWPKPPAVNQAMQLAMEESAANPGRGSHVMAVKASRVIFECRMQLAKLFNVNNANDLAFTHNTTVALNMAIKGILQEGDHVVATMVEHNSVRRPLEYLKRTLGITVDYVKVNGKGELNLRDVEKALRQSTRLLVCTHSSNLLGSILPIAEMGRLAHEHGALFLVDAAQSAGILDIDIERMNVDMMAFPGHKGLLGPQGTGGLYIGPHVDLEPLIHGGTGSQSEEKEQPSVRPDRYEAGTPNTVGLAGLTVGVKKVIELTPKWIYSHEWSLTQRMMEGLMAIPQLTLLGPDQGQPRTGIVSFVHDKYDSSEIAFRLDREYGIAVRAGFHCTPLAHYAIHTEKSGAVRVSVGLSTTEAEVDELARAIKQICSS